MRRDVGPPVRPPAPSSAPLRPARAFGRPGGSPSEGQAAPTSLRRLCEAARLAVVGGALPSFSRSTRVHRATPKSSSARTASTTKWCSAVGTSTCSPSCCAPRQVTRLDRSARALQVRSSPGVAPRRASVCGQASTNRCDPTDLPADKTAMGSRSPMENVADHPSRLVLPTHHCCGARAANASSVSEASRAAPSLSTHPS
jgi:hypothetical protein